MAKAKAPYKLRLFDRPNFDGQSLELTEDMKSIQEKWLRREVQSCKVLEGSWIFFEHPNFCGRQYQLEKGEYRHHSEWGALKPTVGSIKIITELPEPKDTQSTASGAFRICVYERPDFSGQMLESTEDLKNLLERWNLLEIHSAQVQDGAWVFYELPDYRGRQYLLERGQYRRFTEWAAMNPSVGSFRRVINF
ncbi:hypothetical protein FQN60_018532 [Etheostoma spectabile]|uniref:Beta/gamma crystallin 'Greek key' domain-containing protein n=1 Tax=Etheostoma spectabile TaxID=54343 RepID=A0A5J5DIA6_9PERO|nr:hypothetical protein FQN60_018532 [Etheostoma spectabile]